MVRIHTHPITTAMIDGPAIGNWTDERFPDHSMRFPRMTTPFSALITKIAVATGGLAPGPFPTISSGIDLRPEPEPSFNVPESTAWQSQAHAWSLIHWWVALVIMG